MVEESDMKLDECSREAWSAFLGNEKNLGHTSRSLVGDSIDSHVDACWKSALQTVQRIQQDVPELAPKCILEVGASSGLNCLALQKQWPQSKVLGIEPEVVAVRAAEAMANPIEGRAPKFIVGVGERLPLDDGSVDLIVCHTVIEHVKDVDAVISEMARVLSPNGVIHLEAPNYVWPYEPHLGIWCMPLLGKAGVRLAARLQGKGQQIPFLQHLQFVTPSRLESVFSRCGLAWENRVQPKLQQVLSGNTNHIKAYRRSAGLIRILALTGLGGLLVRCVLWGNLYPSVLYTCRKQRGG